ncbi:MAG: riboflavin synthase [Pseudodesulfovibrio sp.]|uniref:Riboflavin synthase n=1 Tax=Pseudodesulfovibrio aespoeensis (strain ATCC 700646 / DSM 10631 / Aspo-2) TaxID=643562 RepID=E6VXJ6_PSEA9|nr:MULTISPECIES: riboflavin synthase [Pseudodesulfovibrio]MBU4242942.1 riboflavin synthase [Pseudomonadota bacterium]ADU63812.1 riboflavin synthase, alpha subunit [Pseudodesulfovibrio aespoeensis Aspo-2]MBU4379216.1 riboflavin synthase [Pseudomonadota bacterium]MBU4475594.1 riboflavin synthase [Pseudomonadota bacterium]MBU4515032.1 riboflavin synthase [Pseudomonadota bacterium]
MFTGLIMGMGRVEAADARGAETRLRIRALFPLSDIEAGESIAVNGTCLTVETFGNGWFTAYASRETLSVTSLGALKVGSQVNLERAMAMGDRFGGHIVAGHVDCLAEVAGVRPAGESRIYRLTFPLAQGRHVIPKGSVALDGISLTVNDCGPDWLEVNIIPKTQEATTIAGWTPGRRVNMETDIIGKYVERMVAPWTDRQSDRQPDAASGQKSAITMDYLREHGF